MWTIGNPSGILIVAQAPRFEFLRTQLCVKDTPYSSDYKKSLIVWEALCSKEFLPPIDSDDLRQLKLCLYKLNSRRSISPETWQQGQGPIEKGLSDSNKAEGTKIKLLVLISHAHNRLSVSHQPRNRIVILSVSTDLQTLFLPRGTVGLNMCPAGKTSNVVSTNGAKWDVSGSCASPRLALTMTAGVISINDDGIQSIIGNTSNVVITFIVGASAQRPEVEFVWCGIDTCRREVCTTKVREAGSSVPVAGHESLGLPAIIIIMMGYLVKVDLLKEVECRFLTPGSTKKGQTIMPGLKYTVFLTEVD